MPPIIVRLRAHDMQEKNPEFLISMGNSRINNGLVEVVVVRKQIVFCL